MAGSQQVVMLMTGRHLKDTLSDDWKSAHGSVAYLDTERCCICS